MRDNEARVAREGLSKSALPDLEARLEKLNRRARKLGVPELRLEVSAPYVREVPAELPGAPPVKYEAVDVAVVGETPHLAGWELVAVIEHEEGENLTRPVPGVEANISVYRDAPPHCDHCGTTRHRLETFIVRNESGVLSQVGRNCLADFLGGQSPQAVLWLAGWISEVGSDDFWSFGGMKMAYVVEPETFLGTVAALIRIDGWMGRTKAREWGKVATVDDAWVIHFPPKSPDRKYREWRAARETTDADRETGKAALAWARELPPDDPNEYRSNLGRVARKEAWVARRIGLGGSAVSSYLREMEREVAFRKAAEGYKREHVGTVGERLRGLDLELVSAKSFEGDYGPRTLVVLVDSERRRFKWWASGSKYTTSEPGTKLHVDATVKKHEEWKGMLETVLSRVTEVDPNRKAPKARKPRKKTITAGQAATSIPNVELTFKHETEAYGATAKVTGAYETATRTGIPAMLIELVSETGKKIAWLQGEVSDRFKKVEVS